MSKQNIIKIISWSIAALSVLGFMYLYLLYDRKGNNIVEVNGNTVAGLSGNDFDRLMSFCGVEVPLTAKHANVVMEHESIDCRLFVRITFLPSEYSEYLAKAQKHFQRPTRNVVQLGRMMINDENVTWWDPVALDKRAEFFTIRFDEDGGGDVIIAIQDGVEFCYIYVVRTTMSRVVPGDLFDKIRQNPRPYRGFMPRRSGFYEVEWRR